DIQRLRASASSFELGKLADAETMYRQALAIYRKLGDDDHEAGAFVSLGCVMDLQGKLSEAEATYRAALPLSKKLDDENPDLRVCAENLKDDLRFQGKLAAEGITIYNELPE